MPPQNILFLIVDDLNSWVGTLNEHPSACTPNTDKLADRGALFSRAYCSAPYCNASRMGIFTGLYPFQNGVYHNEPFWEVGQRQPTFLEVLKEENYY
ncbi:MAG: sulfatase-like hydrolase/transferase, partial [Pseudomonadota bacterium]